MATQLVTPNLDPVIYQGGVALNNWAGWCLAYVQTAFGTGWAGARAWHAWENAQHKRTNRSFPRNVYFPVWFSHFGTYGGVYGNFGHTAIAFVRDDGQMQIWSSPASNKPYADVFTSIEAIERIFNSSYVGWSEDIGGTRVVDSGTSTVTTGGYTVDTIKSMYWRLLGREGDQGGIDHHSANVTKLGWDFVYNDMKNSPEGQADWQRRNPGRVASLEKGIEDRDNVINQLRSALAEAQNKPAVEIIKEVEKIVEVPVEVIKEVPTGGYSDTDREIARETNNLIKSLIAKISGIFRV